MVKIRMSRAGRPHRPFFRINAVDSRVKRDGKVIEALGWYDPMATKTAQRELKIERLRYWLSVGAQPSETVKDMLVDVELYPKERREAEIKARIEAKKKAADKAAAAGGGEKKADAAQA